MTVINAVSSSLELELHSTLQILPSCEATLDSDEQLSRGHVSIEVRTSGR